jgi:beta-lactamase regulating signal transducer with metallopeptidase domain
VISSLAVLGLCIPSFLWLEPEKTPEAVGVSCLVAAALGAAVWTAAITRGFRAAAQSRRYSRLCARAARPERFAENVNISVVDVPVPVLALAGVTRPRTVISRGLLEALSPEQLAAAVAHEEAHRRSGDNLKRLALLATPEILPGVRAYAALDRAWVRISEWAADEGAVSGDPQRRLALAEALVRTVRLGWTRPVAGPLAASLLEDPVDLETRVARLLDDPVERRPATRYGMAAAIAAVSLAALAMYPDTLYSVHWLLEGLMR